MDADQTVAALRATAVDTVYLVDHLLYGATREFVAEHVNRNLAVSAPERTNGRHNSLYRAGVRERLPVAEAVEDDLASLLRVGNPLATVFTEHIAAFIIQHLNALHLRVDL